MKTLLMTAAVSLVLLNPVFASQAKINSGLNTFEITSPTDQRDIIVLYGAGSGDGAEPPK